MASLQQNTRPANPLAGSPARWERNARVFAISDIHVDYEQNMSWVQKISAVDYRSDALIVGGDVTGDFQLLRQTLESLKAKFAHVFFVPGNHDLWIRKRDYPDSMTKFSDILKLCLAIGVHIQPVKLRVATMNVNGGSGVWIVPLFSWYRKPEEGDKSLFVTKTGEDPAQNIWADDHFTKWKTIREKKSVADIFLEMNEANLRRHYDAPIISFSHFVPRLELIFYTQEEIECIPANNGAFNDVNPEFNFSRVAGCKGLEEQIRRLASAVHVYGHQHRNRVRRIDGTRYISHCLGYPQERESRHISNLEAGPILIWPE